MNLSPISNPLVSFDSQAIGTILDNDPVLIIDAVNDAGSVYGFSGGTAIANLLVNDTLNGFPATTETVKTSFVSSSFAGVSLSGTSVVVAPETPQGVYTLNYRICELANPANCDEAMVTVVVKPSIAAVDDLISTNEDVPVSGNVMTNDTNPDGVNLFVSQYVVNGITHPAGEAVTFGGVGTLVINSNGSFTFTPYQNYFGPVPVIIYSLSDGKGGIYPAKLTIVVLPVNDPPVAVDDAGTVKESSLLIGTSLLANDSDPEGDKLTISTIPVKGPSHGTLTINTDGTYVYVPAPNYNGTDSFVYRVCDNGTPQLCSTATVVITVIPVNNVPTLVAPVISVTMVENTGPKIVDIVSNVLNVDGDIITISLNGSPLHGKATVSAKGEILYTPNSNFVGNDFVNYLACDNGTPSLCAQGQVLVTVTPIINNPPKVSDIAKTIVMDQTLPFTQGDFTTHYTDADNDNLVTVRIETMPLHGQLQLNGADIFPSQVILLSDLGRITYKPVKGYTGDDNFMWSASDGKEWSTSPAAVVITVTKSDIFIPEGFSPNGDGINDYFVIRGADKYVINLQVFNRWGNKVYESQHYINDWNGLSNIGLLLGNQLPGGTYYYIVNLNNGEKSRVGYLTLNR